MQAPDEEGVSFKAAYALAFNGHLRLHIEPEHAHPAWNNLKSAIRHSGLQGCLLKSTLCSHVNHGPFGSGKAMASKQEWCQELISKMSHEEWLELQEEIEEDRKGSNVPVPSTKQELLKEPTIAKRGIYAARQHVQHCNRSCW